MKKLSNNNFLFSITTLATGSVLAQLITVLCSPILTRLFTPAEMGAYTYLLSFGTIFLGVINAKYNMAVVVEQDKRNVFALIKLSIIIGLIITILGSAIFVGYNAIFNKTFKIDEVLFIFFLLLSYALIEVLTAYNNREKEYKIMASVSVIRSFFQNIGAVILGFFKVGKLGLIIPYVVGQYMGVGRQGKTLKNNIKDIKSVTKDELKAVMVKHKRQPLFSAPAALANNFSYSSITIFLKTIFGNTFVGFYSISVTLLGMPLSLISGNVSKVFFESAVKEYNQTGEYTKSFKKVFLFQLALAIPMVLIMYFFGPPICAFVFGSEWRVAGDYIQILAPMFGIRFIVTTLSAALIIVNKQMIDLILQILFVLSSVLCFVLCYFYRFSITKYLTIITILFSIVYLVYLGVIYYYSKDRNKNKEVVNN